MAEDQLGDLNHGRILSLREESDGDKKSLSIGVWRGNGSLTVWENGKRPAQFPVNGSTSALLRVILNAIKSGDSKLDRYPITKRDYNQDERKYVPKVQCAIVVDMENDRPRIVIELAENKERFRFPVTVPKGFDVESCEFSKRQWLETSVAILEEALFVEMPIAKRLSSWPRDNKGGGNRSGGGGGGNRSGGSWGGGGGGKSRSSDDDDDDSSIPF